MIRLADNLWIGGEHDEALATSDDSEVDAVLNVAQDMHATCGWRYGIDYMQVGLVDGPGNTPGAYCAAVLALDVLIERGRCVLVCCHGGSRSMAVVIMWMHAVSRTGWEHRMQLLEEQVDQELPRPHQAHRDAFNEINWKLLSSVMGDG